ncbi:MAG: sugar transferase [Bacteroidaceae bacterium]|nr:sugar transferase [Bacteroidaceae bacterium]
MKIITWEQLPPEMQTEEVKKYYDILAKKKVSLFFKRAFDVVASLAMLIVFSPVFLILAIAIKLDSPGPVFYRQERVTQYGKRFRIHKFRTMVQNADKGSQVTVNNDSRITRVGKMIRDFRLDEVAQLLDVISGAVTLVGVRPESPRYVAEYTDEMMATLLLPAGVTNLACIYYKDEAKLLDGVDDPDRVYVEEILPGKMYYNLKGMEQFSFWGDIKIMFMTVFAVLGKEYKGDYAVYEKAEDLSGINV